MTFTLNNWSTYDFRKLGVVNSKKIFYESVGTYCKHMGSTAGVSTVPYHTQGVS